MKAKQTHFRHGFTLVELLVVIVIVALLATLGFVGAKRVLNKAHEATAIGNMRQISQGLFSIQADGGVLGPHKLRASFPGEGGHIKPGGAMYSWVTEVAESMGYGKYDTHGWGGKFQWTMDPNDTAFHDPTADWDIEWDADHKSRGKGSFWQTAHYGYNIRLGAFINPWGANYTKGGGGYDSDKQNVLSKVRYPSDLIFLAQAAASNGLSSKEEKIKKEIDFSFNTNGAQLITPWAGGDGTTAVRIRGGANAVMSDGSVRWINTKKLYDGGWESPHFEPDTKKPRKDIYK